MKKLKKIENFLYNGQETAKNVSGMPLAAAGLPALKLLLEAGEPLCVTLPDAQSADRFYQDMLELMRLAGVEKKVLMLPECGRGKLLFPGGEARRARALNSVLNEKFDLIVGSVHAWLGPAPKPQESESGQLELHPGMVMPMQEIVEKLVQLDYDDEAMVSVSGEFSRRGGILDIFSPAHDEPCRVEFFDDEIESLRFFSPETQRSSGKAELFRIINRAGITAGGAAESDAFAYMERSGKFRVLNIFPDTGVELLKKYSVPGAPERWEKVNRENPEYNFYEIDQPGSVTAEVRLPLAAESGGDILAVRESGEALRKKLLEQLICDASGNGAEVVLCTAEAEDLPVLEKWANDNGLSVCGAGFMASTLQSGFFLPGKILLLTENELVPAGFRLISSDEHSIDEVLPAEVESVPVDGGEFSLTDFDEGDYVVHVDYGIAIYRGVKLQQSNGESREVLVLEFRDGQELYVSMVQAAKISRYLGATGKVKLHALNSNRWRNEKENARLGVRSYAADMLRFQAVRQAVPGISFRADARAMAAFQRAFPFKDTRCQSRSTIEIKRDMLAAKPMDRLLCGDVGYGKTEIAMRAAFRAVSAGYQVAVIAPTTVLAHQHYRSFCERFREFPYTIEVVSRFRTAGEQQQIAEKLLSGGIDILIGTHRLCGKTFSFRNLGLVVIDEEQRFGVEQKERLRRFRVESDVLSMSATPIPRTLYMAMAGARDLSTLVTPPKLRLPVKTVVAPQEDELISAAIRAELARGGQVYYLHNRVQSIGECAAHLRELVPDARIAVAHGQMPEAELEEIMTVFLDGGIDCLVCSTIIESGLDVPNANTIIIERADRFGLAQLYQLRGRVGRWKNQAYAYMLLPKNQLVGTNAKKRLAAIRRCSTLGAGFQLALRDLEIRGAGNLLGSEQSGHLCMIGFDLYCRLLKQEIARLRSASKEDMQQLCDEDLLADVELNIDFLRPVLQSSKVVHAAAIPREYIDNERLRISAYRRLAEIRSEQALEDFYEELRDRYGKLPEETENLLILNQIRILGSIAGIRKVSVVNGMVHLHGSGGVIYRENGRLPRLDPRDSFRLRIRKLTDLLRKLAGVLDQSCKKVAADGIAERHQ
ncbi:MAG: transcription-repair coupling factor [Lentisphaerae bacterium]|nr:transcription-repair coupling factor [Lentisphaerota bacterium]